MKNILTLPTKSDTQKFQPIMTRGTKFNMIVSALCPDMAPLDPETNELKDKHMFSTAPHIYT